MYKLQTYQESKRQRIEEQGELQIPWLLSCQDTRCATMQERANIKGIYSTL